MACRDRKQGFSLLEVVVSLAILAMIMTPVVALLRGSQQVWEDRESDIALLEGAHATVRHIVRSARSARRVEFATPSSNPMGQLILRLPDNRQLRWERRGDAVYYGERAADSLLARNIEGLSFTGFEADGVTPTEVAANMRFIEVSTNVRLDRIGDPLRVIRSKVWLRAY